MADRTPVSVKALVAIFNATKGLFSNNSLTYRSLDFRIALVGSEVNRAWADAKLGLDAANIVHYASNRDPRLKSEPLVLDLGKSDIRNSQAFDARLSQMLHKARDMRIAIASRSDVLRPMIVNMIIEDWANLSAVVTFADSMAPLILSFSPPTELGGEVIQLVIDPVDIAVFTSNQVKMMLEIAACHNLAPDPAARLTELIPVIGGSFLFRIIARHLVAFMPAAGDPLMTYLARQATIYTGSAVNHFYATGGPAMVRQNIRPFVRKATGIRVLQDISGGNVEGDGAES